MIELKISSNDEGQRLNKFLMKYLSAAPSSFIYKMLRKKNIVLNDIKAKGDEMLKSGDRVKLYLSDDTIAKFRSNTGSGVNRQEAGEAAITPDSLKVLYIDKDIMAVHKPVGILSQKAKPSDYSINECIVDYCRNNAVLTTRELETFTPSVCNRLDRNTSGIILAGISLRGSQKLSRILRDRTADKYYFTIVKGHFEASKHVVSYISRDEASNSSVVIDENTYKLSHKGDKSYSAIETEFTPLSFSDGYTLLKVKLITGKSHQIRAHLKYLGYPVIGDSKYGDVSCNRFMRDKYKLKNQLLHAGLVILPDGTRIKDDLPEQFQRICKGLNLNFRF